MIEKDVELFVKNALYLLGEYYPGSELTEKRVELNSSIMDKKLVLEIGLTDLGKKQYTGLPVGLPMPNGSNPIRITEVFELARLVCRGVYGIAFLGTPKLSAITELSFVAQGLLYRMKVSLL